MENYGQERRWEADDDVQDDDDDVDDVATMALPAGHPPTQWILFSPCDAFDMHEQQRQAGRRQAGGQQKFCTWTSLIEFLNTQKHFQRI